MDREKFLCPRAAEQLMFISKDCCSMSLKRYALKSSILTQSKMKLLSEMFFVSKLIPLDKNSGLRPVGLGNFLRRIAGKLVMKAVEEDIKKPGGCFQSCAGKETGCEAAILLGDTTSSHRKCF